LRDDHWLDGFLAAEGLPDSFRTTVEWICRPLADRAARLRQVRRRTATIGLCGAQGLGKSTIAAGTVQLLRARGLTAVAVALDDFYLPRSAREQLAKEVHPLLVTRGPPGTHDVAMAGATLDHLRGPGRVTLPQFDKAADTRAPRGRWETVATPVDVVIFEGWCVGARGQGQAALANPVNELERIEDPDRRWRTWVNDQLDGPYQELFAKLNSLVLLQAPDFEVVRDWRAEQEAKLRARSGRGMEDAEIARFVAHYERLTRWILAEMPERADWTVRLDARRMPVDER
jgi:D-glycerate 3-kinase